MSSLLNVYCVSMIFWKIIFANDVFITTIADIKQFYLATSVIIVFDTHQFGFPQEQRLLNAIKLHSDEYSMSQAISFDQLTRVSSRRENGLYVLVIKDRENLEHAINVTRNTDMSANYWLLLVMEENTGFDCDKPGKNFFKLRFDTNMIAVCQGNNMVKRYYGIIEDQTEVADLAEWAPGKKLKFIDMKNMIDVHTDMRGITLKLAKRDVSIEAANGELTKFLAHLMSELEILGNFTTEVTVRDISFGYYDTKSKQWTGLVNVLYNKQADIGMFLLSMSKSRLPVVDFAAPIARARFYLYAKLPDTKKVLWGAYFQAFDLNTWMVLGASILIIAVVLSLIKNRCHRDHFVHNSCENFINIWGIHCQQGLTDSSPNSAIQIIYFSILITSLVLNAIYSATITSYITVLSTKLPFNTYQEFLRDTTYDVTVLKGSRDEILIMSDDPYLRPLQPRLKMACLRPTDPYEGFRQACEPNTAFYSDEVAFDGLKENPPCQLGQLDMDRVEYESIILTKNSPYTKAISYFITRLRDHGLLRRLKKRYFYKYTEIPENHPNVISFEEALPILAVWGIGVIATLIVWFFELFVSYTSSPTCPTND